MDIKITGDPSRNGKKIWHGFEWGRKADQRKRAGMYTWAKPKDATQKNHNKEILNLLEIKRSQMVLEFQSIGTGYIPEHKFKPNFLDYYADFVEANKRNGNRHLQNSLNKFKNFLKKDSISPVEITKNLCEQFRQYLLDNFNGSTPLDYFTRFKRVIEAATDEGYFRISPVKKVASKAHPSGEKDRLTVDEFKTLINRHCPNHEVKKAAVTSLYTGFRWVDVKKLQWWQIKEESIILKKQSKTGEPIEVPLHPVVKAILGERGKPDSLVFSLPTANGANKLLGAWVLDADIEKHITWHCLRHSVSDILQDAKVDLTTVAAFLGHTTAKYVLENYKKKVKQMHINEASKHLPA